MTNINDWLLDYEPDFYKRDGGKDPYAITVTSLNGLEVKKTPARLLAYADNDYNTAHVIYLDGKRDIVFKEQMKPREETK